MFLFWAERGVRIFRVDNPHTKPFAFWEWVIAEVRERHPDAVFLSEAFTRPAPMQRLAKAGFSQSYSYFTWRNTKWELTRYLEDLYGTPRCASTCARTSLRTRQTSTPSSCSAAGAPVSRAASCSPPP